MMAKAQQGETYPVTVMLRGKLQDYKYVPYNVCTGEEYGEFTDSKSAWDKAEEKSKELKGRRRGSGEEKAKS